MRSLRDDPELFPTARDARADRTTRSPTAARRFGANRLTPLPREPVWKKFLEKFDEPIIKILLAAALLKMVVDLFEASRSAGGARRWSSSPSLVGAARLQARRAGCRRSLFGSAVVLRRR